MDKVILVDAQDNIVGSMDKMEAHQKGVLHRAFSILIFNSKGELLLQKRSKGKYHSGGLWTNACCSHPAPGEQMNVATRKRLMHEMGIDLQPEFAYKFIYRSKLDKDLTEHELDHVFKGIFDGTPEVNINEVEDWKFVDVNYLRRDMREHPENYTIWFRLIMNHPELKEIAA
ncbi:isopentenyl-diphosphate Delta-isomerase [Chryseolinea sp. H1M3-3]|uniref:isopentenyl-diphosphate Delta-isomerase n=1 Tax=Chryseolinea sp. H1M3-3 TaxID=3034144 RepID=UPI0023EB526A|nr:isopentenyl-diphosphate Delta-isomerase [Chryseolinea sp. H1M3-3]